jgi:hypothetical protein
MMRGKKQEKTRKNIKKRGIILCNTKEGTEAGRSSQNGNGWFG